MNFSSLLKDVSKTIIYLDHTSGKTVLYQLRLNYRMDNIKYRIGSSDIESGFQQIYDVVKQNPILKKV